jgi:predicted lipoprotein with Yx(FWY)xxD motif
MRELRHRVLFGFGFAALIISAAEGFVAIPWKTMHASAHDGYSAAMGIAIPHSNNDALNASNCYDACAAAWARFVSDADAEANSKDAIVTQNNVTATSPATKTRTA